MNSETFGPSSRRVWNFALPAIAIFLMFGLTIAMPLWDPVYGNEKVAVFVGCLALFGSLSVGSGLFLLAARTIVEVDDEGLTKRIGGKAERVRWADLVSLRSGNTDGTDWRLGCRDGRTMKLTLYFIDDRERLKSVLHDKRSALPLPSVDSFAIAGRWLLGPLMAAVCVALAWLGYYAFTPDSTFFRREFDRKEAGVVAFIGVPLLAWATLVLFTRRYRIEGDHLVKRSIFGKKSIPLRIVSEIRLASWGGGYRSSPTESMKLTYDGKREVVNSSYANYAILRDRVVALAPQAKIEDVRTMRV
ncbi:MAG TPA: hypothetical protein VHE55_08210 [Fimbriimonadaceae bacterium]|nr:hypothetical protein [Fimbriimonadaceae bacterium]